MQRYSKCILLKIHSTKRIQSLIQNRMTADRTIDVKVVDNLDMQRNMGVGRWNLCHSI